MTMKRLILASLLIVALLGLIAIAEAAPEWQVTIKVTSGEGKGSLALGADPTATDGRDKLWDSYAMLGGQFRVYFPRPEWGVVNQGVPFFDKFWRDIRAKAPGTTTEWPFVIESDLLNQDVLVTWDLSLIPADYPVSLVLNDMSGQVIDMRNNASYDFPYTVARNFSVKVYTPLENPPNLAPVANAGPDQVIELASCDGATVTLDGSASSDPEGGSLTYVWTWDGGTAEGPNPVVTFPMGTTVATLTVTDIKGLSSSDTVKISINDTAAATLNVSVSPKMLWPANHKYVKVIPTVTVSEACVPKTTVELLSVTSSEPDSGLGRGDRPNDIVINPDGTFYLRAERADKGKGRVYTVTYVATDMAGNQTTGGATVKVRHREEENDHPKGENDD